MFLDSQKALQEAKTAPAGDFVLDIDFDVADEILGIAPQTNRGGGPSFPPLDSASESTAPVEVVQGEVRQSLNIDSPSRTTTTTTAPHSAPGGFVCLVSRICVSCLLV